jgi:hypothetical protein
MTVTGNPSTMIRRRLGAVFGPIFSDKRYFIHNGSLQNTVRGLVERVFRVRDKSDNFIPPPAPKSEKHYRKMLLPEMNMLLDHPKLRPLTTRSVLNLWHGSKLAVYTQAYKSLLVRGLTRRDAFLKTFVKCEKIDASKDDPAPRVIQPRSPRYNLELAAYLKPHEKEFYRRIDAMFDTDGLGDKTVFKGLNARQVAEQLILKSSRFNDPVYIGLDASRFDQHVSDVALRWEHDVYLNSFAYGQRHLKDLLRWQVYNEGRAYLRDGKIKYRVTGRRMSGDMNTSLGNCLLMSSMVHSYLRHKNLGKFALANNGDDCVVIIERRHLNSINDLSSWFLDMGFNMKVEEPVYDIRQVTFCQVNVLTSPGYNICVRNPRICMSKDLHSCFPFTHQHQYREWLIAGGSCGVNSHKGVPVLEAFYRAFPTGKIHDKAIQASLDHRYEYSIVGGSMDREISDEIRHSMWVAFGYVPDAQLALEELCRSTAFGDRLGVVADTPYAKYLQGISLTNLSNSNSWLEDAIPNAQHVGKQIQ